MKKLTNIAISLVLPAVAISGLAMAAKPVDVTILHCGCTAAGYDLEMVELNINTRGLTGHLDHQYQLTDFEACTTSSGVTILQRDRADCIIGDAIDDTRACGSADFIGADCDRD